MKKGYIFGIVVIAIAISMLMATVGDASQYVDFEKAYTMSKNGNSTKIHVVGSLKKSSGGDIVGMSYNPKQNPNLFIFTLVDENQREWLEYCPGHSQQRPGITRAQFVQHGTGDEPAVGPGLGQRGKELHS